MGNYRITNNGRLLLTCNHPLSLVVTYFYTAVVILIAMYPVFYSYPLVTFISTLLNGEFCGYIDTYCCNQHQYNFHCVMSLLNHILTYIHMYINICVYMHIYVKYVYINNNYSIYLCIIIMCHVYIVISVL